MIEYRSSTALRCHNLKIGDSVRYMVQGKDYLGVTRLYMDTGYLCFGPGNGIVFRRLDLYEERRRIAAAVLDVPIERIGHSSWPCCFNQGVSSVWGVAMALFEHLEGTRDLRTYLEPTCPVTATV